MHRNSTELRKVPAAYLDPIAIILDINDDWKRIMTLIPKDLRSDHFEPKYNSEHMRLIEQYAQNNRLRCARVLFDEWGTSGRTRPTLQSLLDVLARGKMYRAAEYLAQMLNVSPPSRPSNGPEAEIDTNVSSILNHTTGEQDINTRKLSETCNGRSNGTYGNQCHDPTKKLESASMLKSVSNFMQFPDTKEQIPNFEILGSYSTAMIPKNNGMQSESDLIKWPKEASAPSSSSQYLPNFKILLRNGERDNSSISTMSGTSTNSETSQSANDFSKSENSQSSHFPIPSMNGLSLYDQVDSEILEDINLIKFQYAELEAMTRNFSNSHIGSGGFGDVFVGDHEKLGLLAIKRAHSLQINLASVDHVKIFNTEVKSLSILRHENVVPILGFSLDGPAPCIVCKYIEGGSLLENIAAKVLNEHQRMNIMIGTSEGLKYIHNTEKPRSSVSGTQTSSRKAYFLHGDVKSANILITKDCTPMLCDFGLAKQCATTFHTESIVGTSAYMAPERFSGTITQKGDTFSYGIVLLELLTGLEPITTEDNGDNVNIKMYVEENCVDGNITSVLDPRVQGWCKAQKIYELAKLCMEQDKNKRPSMEVICNALHEINETEQRVFYANV